MHVRSRIIITVALILGLLVVLYPKNTFAIIDYCQNGTKPGEYKCYENKDTLDLLKCFPVFSCDLSGTIGNAVTQRTCCQIPAVGESGEMCRDKDEIAEARLVASGLGFVDSITKNTSSCFLNICPAKIISDAIASLQLSATQSLGLSSAGNAVFACTSGLPDPQYVDENGNISDKYLVKGNVLCRCINPERNPANAIIKLCIQHVGQVPIAFARTALKGTFLDGIWTRNYFNSLNRIFHINLNDSTPPAAEWKKFISQLGITDAKGLANNDQVRIQFGQCVACASSGGYPSAIGCLPLDNIGKFIAETVFGIGLSFAGAICLLCIIYSAIMLQTSQGSSEQIEKARKILIQCLSGLVFIIFSIFILRFIGVNLLRIYGLS